MTLKKRFPVIGACLFFGWFVLSCGLEDIPFISPVPEGGWFHTVSGTGGINLHLAEGSGNFQRFVIVYRIYLSNAFGGVPETIGHDRDLHRLINPTLDSDFFHFSRLADHTDTAVNTAGLFMNFINRGFLRLELEDANIDNVLGHGSLGRTLTIDFLQETGHRPRLTLDDRQYYLRRAEHSDRFGHFVPVPRTGGILPFFNHPDLRASTNRTDDINADVAPIPANSPPLDYSYVLMYIFAEGLGYGTPPPRVFSQPTYLGVFRLPNH